MHLNVCVLGKARDSEVPRIILNWLTQLTMRRGWSNVEKRLESFTVGIHLLPVENNFNCSCSADWHFCNKQPRWQNHSQWSSWFWEWAALYFVCYCKGKPTDAIEFDVRSPAWGRFKWLVDHVQCPNQFLYWKRISCLMIKMCSLKSDVQIRQMLGGNSIPAKTTVWQYVFTHVDRKDYSCLNNT